MKLILPPLSKQSYWKGSKQNRSVMIGYGPIAAKETGGHVILGGANSGKYSPDLNVYYYHN